MNQLLSSIAFLCLLALPLAAQEEALHGTWEGTYIDEESSEITMRLTFEADGTFALDQNIEGGEDDVESPIEALSVQFSGTYRVEGDSLWVDIVELYYIIDDEKMTPVEFGEFIKEFFIGFARGFARLAADLEGISDEDYPAFEQAFVDEFLAEFDEDEFLADFGFGESEEINSTYAIEGDTLSITTTEEGGVETLELHRIDDATAVVQTTWGDLKAAWRP
ncbi:MAG: hypothetical protein F4Z57_19145 [Gemmatimonadetes bacterium]|nr:hypothetical protein [Gemmatimonadota bacterium]MYC70764.1 hypothetical protein [Gemmatimonadota bacterium]